MQPISMYRYRIPDMKVPQFKAHQLSQLRLTAVNSGQGMSRVHQQSAKQGSDLMVRWLVLIMQFTRQTELGFAFYRYLHSKVHSLMLIFPNYTSTRAITYKKHSASPQIKYQLPKAIPNVILCSRNTHCSHLVE